MNIEEELTKGERTRQVVIEAAYELFLENGFSATSMRQIAERSGLALGGIYNHFPSKDEIFQALIIDKHPFIQIFPVLERVQGKSIDEFIINAAYLVQDELGHNPSFLKLVFIEIVEFNGRHLPKLLETIVPMALPLVERFNTPDGSIRGNIPTFKLMRIFMGNILAFYLTELILNNPKMPSGLRDVTLEDFLDTFLYGILDHKRAQG